MYTLKSCGKRHVYCRVCRPPSSAPAPTRDGVVTHIFPKLGYSCPGNEAWVRVDGGEEILASYPQRELELVVGDRVRVDSAHAAEDGRVVEKLT